eukprot:3040162-Pyramimonas_sp.AAC.1
MIRRRGTTLPEHSGPSPLLARHLSLPSQSSPSALRYTVRWWSIVTTGGLSSPSAKRHTKFAAQVRPPECCYAWPPFVAQPHSSVANGVCPPASPQGALLARTQPSASPPILL